MRRPVLLLAGALLGAPVSGCAPDLSALSNDKNSDCIVVNSVYESVTISRNWGCLAQPPAGLPALQTPAAPALAVPKAVPAS